MAASGCAPSLQIGGAYFPAWLICMLTGLILTVIARGLLVLAGIDGHVRPRFLAYPAMMVAITLSVWLAFYSR